MMMNDIDLLYSKDLIIKDYNNNSNNNPNNNDDDNKDNDNNNDKESKKSGSKQKPMCHCKKSGCLKLYCECFSNSNICSSACVCVSCKNTEDPQNSDDRLKAREATLSRTPFGFKGDKKQKEIVRGCHCLKSHCLKRYCECYQNGGQCSPEFCRCQECKNYPGSLDLELQRSTNPAAPASNDIAVIASSSAHANNRKRTYLLIDDKDNETDRKIQVNTLTTGQALDYFNALLGHEAVKELITYDLQEKLKEKPDKDSISVKELEAERKRKKVAQKLLSTFSDFFELNKDVTRSPTKNRENEPEPDLGRKVEKRIANAPLVGKVAKEAKTAKDIKTSSRATLEDDHVIMEDEAKDLNWKKRLMTQNTNENDNTSDSEVEPVKSPAKKVSKKSEKAQGQNKAGYMFVNLA